MTTKFEFYLSKGSLGKLANSDSLFDSSSQSNTLSTHTLIRSVNPRPILQVVEFLIFEDSPIDNCSRFGLTVYDGEDEMTVTLDKILYDLVENERDEKIKQGSVFLLNEYRMMKLEEFFSQDEIDSLAVKIKHLIAFTNITLVGCAEPLNFKSSDIIDNEKNLSSSQAFTKSANIESTNIANIECSHTINMLRPSFSKSEWSIKFKLLDKTITRKFQNRKTGAFGYVIRMLFLDKTSMIECVVFNDLCNNDNIRNLQINKDYILRNGDIKLSQTKLKAWPEKLSLNFEIHLTNQSEFVEIKNTDNDSETLKLLESEMKSNKIETIDKNNTSQNLHKKFTNFNELFLKSVDSDVDVIGIIIEISELKKIKKNGSLFLRNIKLVDTSSVEVSVAFWGKQAELFEYKIGTCLLINKARLTNFGGLSLSVMRQSEIFEMKESYDIDIVTKLFTWYNKNIENEENTKKKRKLESTNV